MCVRQLVAVSILFFASPASAFPISPVPLWTLVERADLIVLAEVRDTPSITGGSWNSAAAVLAVREVWKGEPLDPLEVPYPAGFICPAPPTYRQGEVVLAFLAHGDDGLYTVGLSYGTLYPHDDEVPVFRQRVREAIALQANGEVTPESRRAWLVETAARRATRWHGLYELAASADGVHSYYDHETRQDFASGIAEVQLQRLAAGLVSEPSDGVELGMMLSLLANFPSAAVDRVAVAAVDDMMYQPRLPYHAGQVVGAVLRRLGAGEAEPQAPAKPEQTKEVSEAIPSDPLFAAVNSNDDALRKLWAAARRQLDIPVQALERNPAPRVPRTGADTPP